ncbi:hypothetical protein BAE44_0014163, partial [Dichanthelium oligosanthes]
MGGLLSTKSRSEREWEAILNHHAWICEVIPMWIKPANHITRHNCTMHDVVRTFAEFMAKEDSLVVLDKQVAA